MMRRIVAAVATGGWLAGLALWAAGVAMAVEAPKTGGTVVAALGADPAVLNPAVSVGVPDVFTGCMVYDALVRFGPGFKILPSLAKSWEISPDGLTYTFHLEQADFTDGKPVTSDDVKFSLLNVASKYGPKFIAPGQFIQAIDTPDPSTVIIRLTRPFGPFLFSLACEQNAAILPKHVFEGTNPLTNPATLTAPVGSGPFVLSEWAHGDHLTFTRNPHYWQKGKPYLDRVVVKIMPDTQARILALRAGEVDFIDEYYFPLSAYRELSHDSRFMLKDVSYPGDDLIILNTKNPPLDKAEVRQALLTAIERDYLHKIVFFGVGGVAVSSIDTRMGWPYNPAINYDKMYAFDPKRAAGMLDAAGVKPGADGTRFTLRLSYDSGRPEYNAMSQALQKFWQAIGVHVVLEGAERPVVLKRVFTDYDFDATLQNYSTGGDPAFGVARIYVSSSIKPGQNFNNASRYSNPEIDDLFAKALVAPAQDERAQLYFKMQEIIAHDLPTLTIHQQAQIDAASSNLQDVFQSPDYIDWGSVWMKNPN